MSSTHEQQSDARTPQPPRTLHSWVTFALVSMLAGGVGSYIASCMDIYTYHGEAVSSAVCQWPATERTRCELNHNLDRKLVTGEARVLGNFDSLALLPQVVAVESTRPLDQSPPYAVVVAKSGIVKLWRRTADGTCYLGITVTGWETLYVDAVGAMCDAAKVAK